MNSNKIAPLQHLRAIAVVMTAMAHLPPFTRLAAAIGIESPFHMGVPLFYGISGFIIFLTTEKQGWTYVAPFYVKRLTRIYPVLALSCLLACLFTLSLSHNATTDQFYAPISVMLAQSAAQLSLIGNLAEVGACLAIVGLWSISVEAQFYLYFGLWLAVPPRIRAYGLLASAAALFAVKLALASHFPGFLNSHIFYFEILLCAAAACIYRPNVRPNTFVLAVDAIFLWLYPTLQARGANMLIIYPILVSCVCYITLCFANGFTIASNRQASVLEWIGARSYVIYVMHFQVIALAGLAMQNAGVNVILPTGYGYLLTLSVVAAAPLYELVHRTIEQAGVDFGHRYAAKLAVGQLENPTVTAR